MTIKKFMQKLEKNMGKDFEVYTNEDECYQNMGDDEVVFCGEDEDECFVFKIIKVE